MANSGLINFFKSLRGRPNFGRANTALAPWLTWVGGTSPTFNSDDPTFAYDEQGESYSRSSIIMAAVNWLGRVLPEAPLQVIEQTPDGEAEITDHPVLDVWNNPNPFYSSATMLKAIGFSWIVSGNPYLLKVRSRGNSIVELWYVPPAQMRPVWNETEYISGYEYSVQGEKQTFDRSDVIHMRDGIDPLNTRLGVSPVASLLREIYSDREVAAYTALLMQNGAVPPVVITPKAGLNLIDFDPEDIRARYIRQTQGSERGKVLVTSGALDVSPVGFNPSELDLKGLRRGPEERVSSVLGIPAIVLGFGAGLDKATYSNARQLTEFATEQYVVPFLRYLGQELTLQLFRDFDTNPKRFLKFDTSQIRALDEDQTALYTRVTAAYNGGVMKRSEARMALGLEVSEDDDMFKPAAAPAFGAPSDTAEPTPDAAAEKPTEAEQDDNEELMQRKKTLQFKREHPKQILKDGYEWLISIGEEQAAAMLTAKKK